MGAQDRRPVSRSSPRLLHTASAVLRGEEAGSAPPDPPESAVRRRRPTGQTASETGRAARAVEGVVEAEAGRRLADEHLLHRLVVVLRVVALRAPQLRGQLELLRVDVDADDLLAACAGTVRGTLVS